MRDSNPEFDLGGTAPNVQSVQKGTSEGVETNPDKPTLRDFSKEFSQADRDKAAEEIWATRKEYFGKKRENTQDIKRLTKEGLNKEKSAEEITKEIEGLENSIVASKQNKILELFSYFKIRKMEENLGIKRGARAQMERDYGSIRDILENLNESVRDKTKLSEAKGVLDNFYAGQEGKWSQHQEELKDRDVKNIANKYDVTFIHGIHPNFIPGDNSMLEDWVDWKIKLKILTTFEPTISTSTIKKGDDWRRMWSRMGVVLSGGSVESASFGDQGSRARGIKERALNRQTGSIQEQIGKAITTEKDPDQLGYNELVVKNPEISGFYVCLEDTVLKGKVIDDAKLASGYLIKNDLVPHEEIAKTAKEMDLNLYAIKDGVVYEAEFDENSKTIVPMTKIESDRVLSERYEVGENRRNAALQEIFEDSPFKIKSPELSYVDSSGYGRQSYISLVGEKNKNLPGIKSEFQDDAYGLVIDSKEQIKVIEEIPIVGQKLRIFEQKGKLCMERINTHGNTKNAMGIERGDLNFPDRYINLGHGGAHDLKRKINSVEDYLRGMGDSITDVKQKIEKFDEEKQNWDEFNRNQMDRTLDNWIKDLAFHLFGFAEQAKKFGNFETQKRAEKIASQVVDKEYYEDVLRRRLDKEGRLKITEEDLN